MFFFSSRSHVELTTRWCYCPIGTGLGCSPGRSPPLPPPSTSCSCFYLCEGAWPAVPGVSEHLPCWSHVPSEVQLGCAVLSVSPSTSVSKCHTEPSAGDTAMNRTVAAPQKGTVQGEKADLQTGHHQAAQAEAEHLMA